MQTTLKNDATKAYSEVALAAETLQNGAHAVVPVMDPGDNVRQGDIYVTRLDTLPVRQGAYEGRQLAPGTTQGSRHVVAGDCTLYRPGDDEASAILGRLVPQARGQRLFVGPVIEAKGEITLEHPEHPHRTLPPGNYLVTYQRSWQEEVRRAQD